MTNETTTMTLDMGNGLMTISVLDEHLSLPELVDLCIVPLLRAAGYEPKTINAYIHNAGGWE